VTPVINSFVREARQRIGWDAVIPEPGRDAADFIELARTSADILPEFVMELREALRDCRTIEIEHGYQKHGIACAVVHSEFA
jgi:hypothetical protein